MTTTLTAATYDPHSPFALDDALTLERRATNERDATFWAYMVGLQAGAFMALVLDAPEQCVLCDVELAPSRPHPRCCEGCAWHYARCYGREG